MRQATDAIKKIQEAGVKHLAYSTLSTYKLDGKVVEHCESKVESKSTLINSR